MSTRLDGTDKIVHVRFWAGDEAVPSPDGKRVALTRGDNVYVAALPMYPTTPPLDLEVEGGAMVPLLGDTFFFQPSTEVYQFRSVGALASAGLAVRLW